MLIYSQYVRGTCPNKCRDFSEACYLTVHGKKKCVRTMHVVRIIHPVALLFAWGRIGDVDMNRRKRVKVLERKWGASMAVNELSRDLMAVEESTSVHHVPRHLSPRARRRTSKNGVDPESRLLYDRKEAARQLSISVRSLDYLIAGGQLETRRIGKKVLIPRGSLARFSQANHYDSPKDVCRQP